MLLSTLTISFIAPDLPAESEAEVLAQTLDIQLQEAGLGTLTDTAREATTLTLSAEVNDEAAALTLVRILLRSLGAPHSTRLEVQPGSGDAPMPLDE